MTNLEIFYVVGTALVKSSILALYHRIFASNARFVTIVICVGVFVWAYSIAEVLGKQLSENNSSRRGRLFMGAMYVD